MLNIKLITEIVDLINEINTDVLNNSIDCWFEFSINGLHYSVSEIKSFDDKFYKNSRFSIDLIINNGFTKTVSMIYTNSTINNIIKEDILYWMTHVIFTENLLC